MLKGQRFWENVSSDPQWKQMVKELIPALNDLIKIDVGGNRYVVLDQPVEVQLPSGGRYRVLDHNMTAVQDPDDPDMGVICFYIHQMCDVRMLPGVLSEEVPIARKDSITKIVQSAREAILNLASYRKQWVETFINRIRSHPLEMLTLYGKYRNVIEHWLSVHNLLYDPIDFAIVDPRFFVACDPILRWPVAKEFYLQKVRFLVPVISAQWIYEHCPHPGSIDNYFETHTKVVIMDVNYAKIDPILLADMLAKSASGELVMGDGYGNLCVKST